MLPGEDNIDTAQVRKTERYINLLEVCENVNWKVAHFPIEAICRGVFFAHSVR